MVYLSLIFWILAAISNSIMDTLQYHYYDSIFYKKLDYKSRSWWNPEISWKNKYINKVYLNGHRKVLNTFINYPVFLTDGWHLFKSSMIVLIVLSIITFDKDIIWLNTWWFYCFILVIYGFAWNLPFNLFYNKILRK